LSYTRAGRAPIYRAAAGGVQGTANANNGCARGRGCG